MRRTCTLLAYLSVAAGRASRLRSSSTLRSRPLTGGFQTRCGCAARTHAAPAEVGATFVCVGFECVLLG
eukprot:scaffold79_cov259-Pinguiococcus_pyrenoidosus.AAC.3